VAAILTIGGDGNVEEEEGDEMISGDGDGNGGFGGDGTTGDNNIPTIRQSFKFFHETENSQHGPKGEERAQLVPYFL
jgi:hypothetical protein